MRFDDLDKQMRVYETAHDHRVLPGLYWINGKIKTDYKLPFGDAYDDFIAKFME